MRTHLSPEALRIEKRRPAITRSEGRHDQKIRPYNRLSRVRGSGPGGPPLRGRTALDTPARGGTRLPRAGLDTRRSGVCGDEWEPLRPPVLPVEDHRADTDRLRSISQSTPVGSAVWEVAASYIPTGAQDGRGTRPYLPTLVMVGLILTVRRATLG